VLSADPDIAVLLVIGANDPSICGDGRLSEIGIAPRAKETTTGRVETTEAGGVVRGPVRWRAAAADSAGGSIFTVEPTSPADHIEKGWSGSVVLDNYGLLGIVFEVDSERNEAYAVRADLIRGLVDSARKGSTSAVNAAPVEALVVQLAGSTPDPNHSSNDICKSGSSACLAEHSPGRISFIISLEKLIYLKGVELGLSYLGDAPSGMDVAVIAAPGSENWTCLNYCPIAKVDTSIHCAVVTSAVRRIRPKLKTGSDSTLALPSNSILNDLEIRKSEMRFPSLGSCGHYKPSIHEESYHSMV